MSKEEENYFIKLVKELNKTIAKDSKFDERPLDQIESIHRQVDYKLIAEEANKAEEAKADLVKALTGPTMTKKKKNETPEEKAERKKLKEQIKAIKGKPYSENELRHAKYKEIKEAREDLSEQVKEVINKLQDVGEYKLATYQGRAGGGRKLLGCPHCKGVMLAAGIKLKRDVDPNKPKTQNQREWQDYVKAVSQIPAYKGIVRSKIMKAASALRAGGYTIDQIKEISDNPVLQPAEVHNA
jgi:hypothetical protein